MEAFAKLLRAERKWSRSHAFVLCGFRGSCPQDSKDLATGDIAGHHHGKGAGTFSELGKSISKKCYPKSYPGNDKRFWKAAWQAINLPTRRSGIQSHRRRNRSFHMEGAVCLRTSYGGEGGISFLMAQRIAEFALIRAPKVSVLKCVTYSNQIAHIRSVSLTVTHCPAAPLALGVCPFGIQTFDQGA